MNIINSLAKLTLFLSHMTFIGSLIRLNFIICNAPVFLEQTTINRAGGEINTYLWSTLAAVLGRSVLQRSGMLETLALGFKYPFTVKRRCRLLYVISEGNSPPDSCWISKISVLFRSSNRCMLLNRCLGDFLLLRRVTIGSICQNWMIHPVGQ